MEFHKVLLRQLAKLNLGESSLPSDSDAWKKFLTHISQSYTEADQDRYLIERSMELSSKEMQTLNEELLNTARQAGMAEVATSVLHNVGNILNSVNVSINLIKESLAQPKIKRLDDIAQLIQNHLHDLPTFLTQDEKGKLLPEYIIKLSQLCQEEYDSLKSEASSLYTNIQHIQEIIASQQSLSGVSGIQERVSLSTLLDEAVRISGGPFAHERITIEKEYADTHPIQIEKAKLLQILVNLIKNAKEAIAESNNEKRTIQFKIQPNHQTVDLIINDSGVGIPNENITKIFSFGYTTKQGGHGFGLHMCALAAQELGGKLEAKSEGVNQGATFILTLPY